MAIKTRAHRAHLFQLERLPNAIDGTPTNAQHSRHSSPCEPFLFASLHRQPEERTATIRESLDLRRALIDRGKH